MAEAGRLGRRDTGTTGRKSCRRLERELARAARTSMILRADLRQVEAVPALVDAVAGRFGRLDILVNNIERGGWPVVHGAYVREQWDLEQETTLRAKRWVFAAALPHLEGLGRRRRGQRLLHRRRGRALRAGLRRCSTTATPRRTARCRCSPRAGRARGRPKCASTRSCWASSTPATARAPAAGAC
ncbi:MAG: SDR family oxidoreductase [Desulfobacterales bacterium]|nr:SDR family oxidoreductase [Desulfobacterales bacterium]